MQAYYLDLRSPDATLIQDENLKFSYKKSRPH